jgi:glycosyltransferase involved in cell wall biosynthesis
MLAIRINYSWDLGMKILLLAQFFPPEPAPGGIILKELATYLVKEGHEVTVVTGFPNYPLGIKYKEYRGKFFLTENIEGIHVIRTFLYCSPNKKAFHRSLNYVSFTLTSLLGMLVSRKHDILYIQSPPFFLGISAIINKALRGCPYIFEVYDLWPQGPIEMGYVKNKFVAKFLLWMEKIIYQKAVKIFVLSNRMKNEIVEKGIPAEKIKVKFNWVDIEFFLFKENDGINLRKEYNLDNKFIVMYAGNIGIVQGLQHIIEAAHILKDRKDIVFAFVGDGIDKEKLVTMKNEKKLDNVIFIHKQPLENMPSFLSMADVALIHLNKIKFCEAAVPSKLLAYMSCGCPVLVASMGAATDIVQEANAGVIAEPENAQSISDAVLFMQSNEDKLKNMSVNARNYALKYFNKETIVKEMEESFQSVILQEKKKNK